VIRSGQKCHTWVCMAECMCSVLMQQIKRDKNGAIKFCCVALLYIVYSIYIQIHSPFCYLILKALQIRTVWDILLVS